MKTLFKIVPLLLLACACTESFFNSVGENVDTDGLSSGHEMIVLGSRLEDPYSLDNMNAALTSLYQTRADRVAVEPTNLYVRFLPNDERQLKILEDSGINMLDHPLDYEIIKEGDYYQDPSIEEGKITWQYAVVKINYSFPKDVKYEVLDQCYIPDEQTTKADWVDWDAVERESFRLTGNSRMLQPLSKDGESTSGTPEGRISIIDYALGSEAFGVKGVKVSCNCFVKFANAFTDEDGKYKMTTSFASNPRYRLIFNNSKGFRIGFNLLLIPASISTLGSNSPEGVDLVVSCNSERKLFSRCVVNNAAYEYYDSCDGETQSMKTPPANLRIWIFQNLQTSSSVMMQQGVLIDGSLISNYLGEYTSLLKMFLPDITLGLRGKNDYASIYADTIHELAHSTHFMQVGKNYWNTYIQYILKSFITSGFVTYGVGTEDNYGYCEVGEMWAYYLETMLYRERYKNSDTLFGTTFWFSPQIFLFLDDRGMNRYKIANAITSDVTNRDILQKKLISLYPEFKSAIIQVFTRYN